MHSTKSKFTPAPRLLIATLLLGSCTLANATDRPFLEIDTAIVEDDDERTFQISTWAVRRKRESATQAMLEYSFTPTLGLELQLGWVIDKLAMSRERTAELELKNVWLNPDREGWGLGTSISAGLRHPDSMNWKYDYLRAVMNYSLPMLEKQFWLHVNTGLERNDESKIRGILILGAEARLRKQITLVSEYSRKEAGDSFFHSGVRWWPQKEKIALDFSLGRAQPREARSEKFFTFGVSFYDLSY
jgi:hypothetical protein